MNQAAARRLLGLLGLGARARTVVIGVEQVRVAARRGRLALAVVASDASPNSRKKIEPLLGAIGVRVVRGPEATALGSSVGKGAAAVVGILDPALARGVRQVLVQEGVPEEGERRGAKGAPARQGARRIG
ncbi:MAG: ribosomal L7Ae/L30e/S12e/Gadd45 family protein [Gemmatimonadaceae bacterium]|nr:ribosomal L7Ae/L30e/S12e/Gadd45 family protein [Gemmatimonadaceae bacterium]